jgi:hypothetical protein
VVWIVSMLGKDYRIEAENSESACVVFVKTEEFLAMKKIGTFLMIRSEGMKPDDLNTKWWLTELALQRAGFKKIPFEEAIQRKENEQTVKEWNDEKRLQADYDYLKSIRPEYL